MVNIEPAQKVVDDFCGLDAGLFDLSPAILILHNLDVPRSTLNNLIDFGHHTLFGSHNLLEKGGHVELGVVCIELLVFLADDVAQLDDFADAVGLDVLEGLDLELAGVLVDLVVALDAAGAQRLHADQAVVAVQFVVLGAHQLPVHN